MKVDELSSDQMDELKLVILMNRKEEEYKRSRFRDIATRSQKKHGKRRIYVYRKHQNPPSLFPTSWEVMHIDEIISDAEVKREFGDLDWSPSDFFCTPGQETA